MKFELDNLIDYSDDALLKEIVRVSKIVPDGSLTKKLFAKHSKAYPSTIVRRFGGWEQALNLAGIGHRYVGKTVTSKMKQSYLAKNITNADIIKEIKRVASVLEKFSFTMEEFTANSNYGINLIRGRFKKWSTALSKSGLDVSTTGRRYSDSECFENLLNVWTFYGRPPKYLEMNKPPSKVGAKAYNRWGKWRLALDAFIKYTNNNDKENEEEMIIPNAKSVQIPTEVKAKDKRTINLGLRYKVLKRDGFKCLKCGKSPATNLGVELHVDHKIPFSKGGKTETENLQTLCRECNLGKSNK